MKYTFKDVSCEVNGKSVVPTDVINIELNIPKYDRKSGKRLAICSHLDRDKMTDDQIREAFCTASVGDTGEIVDVLACYTCKAKIYRSTEVL